MTAAQTYRRRCMMTESMNEPSDHLLLGNIKPWRVVSFTRLFWFPTILWAMDFIVILLVDGSVDALNTFPLLLISIPRTWSLVLGEGIILLKSYEGVQWWLNKERGWERMRYEGGWWLHHVGSIVKLYTYGIVRPQWKIWISADSMDSSPSHGTEFLLLASYLSIICDTHAISRSCIVPLSNQRSCSTNLSNLWLYKPSTWIGD